MYHVVNPFFSTFVHFVPVKIHYQITYLYYIDIQLLKIAQLIRSMKDEIYFEPNTEYSCLLSKILSPYLFILFGKFAIIRIRRQSIYVLANNVTWKPLPQYPVWIHPKRFLESKTFRKIRLSTLIFDSDWGSKFILGWIFYLCSKL